MNTQQVAIALDVGGSSVKSGVVDADYRVGEMRTDAIDSRADADTIIGVFEQIIRHHLQAIPLARCQGIAFGFPGPTDYAAGISYIHGLQKYEAIYGLNVKTLLAERLTVPPAIIHLRNDAEAAVVGEAQAGAGKRYRRVIGITLGTGLGSSHLIDGRPQESGAGVPVEGWLGAVPYRGELSDDWFSTRGLARRLQAAGATTSLSDASAQARTGDTVIAGVYATFGDDLGAFLQPYVRDFEAEVVVVLGGITAAFDLFGPALMAQVSAPVLCGELGTQAALIGAANLVFGSAAHSSRTE